MPKLEPDYLYPKEEQEPLTEKRLDVPDPDNRPILVLGLVLLFGMASMLVAIVNCVMT